VYQVGVDSLMYRDARSTKHQICREILGWMNEYVNMRLMEYGSSIKAQI
jgi:hypothetical protein